VQVGPLATEPDLGQVPASVVVVADVQRLVDVLDQVDQEEQGARALAPRRVAVGEDRAEVPDLGDDAVPDAAVGWEDVAAVKAAPRAWSSGPRQHLGVESVIDP
jgi:hypothetical protein